MSKVRNVENHVAMVDASSDPWAVRSDGEDLLVAKADLTVWTCQKVKVAVSTSPNIFGRAKMVFGKFFIRNSIS